MKADSPSLVEFLLERIAEDEAMVEHMQRERTRAREAPIFRGNPADWLSGVDIFVNPDRWAAECAAKRAIIEFHNSWPVFVETEPTFEPAVMTDVSSTVFRMSKRITWMTEREYVARFGTEPPTSTILLALAQPYSDHPDFDASWSLS